MIFVVSTQVTSFHQETKKLASFSFLFGLCKKDAFLAKLVLDSFFAIVAKKLISEHHLKTPKPVIYWMQDQQDLVLEQHKLVEKYTESIKSGKTNIKKHNKTPLVGLKSIYMRKSQKLSRKSRTIQPQKAQFFFMVLFS